MQLLFVRGSHIEEKRAVTYTTDLSESDRAHIMMYEDVTSTMNDGETNTKGLPGLLHMSLFQDISPVFNNL
jgi:hypothetical protein